MKTSIMTILIFAMVMGRGMCQDTTYVGIGEEFSATVRMELQGEISAVGFDIVYNPTEVEYISYDLKQVFSLEICNPRPGRLSVGLTQSQPGDYVKDCARDLILVRFKLLKKYAEIKFENGEILRDNVNPGYQEQWEGGVVRSEQIPGGSVLLKVIISR